MTAERSGRSAAVTAAAILACAGAGGHLAGAAADGWFLAAVGPTHLGAAVAGSSLLVAIVLAAVGALADRRDRRRTLVALGASGAVLLAIVSVAHDAAPRAAAIVGFVATKQIQAVDPMGVFADFVNFVDRDGKAPHRQGSRAGQNHMRTGCQFARHRLKDRRAAPIAHGIRRAARAGE